MNYPFSPSGSRMLRDMLQPACVEVARAASRAHTLMRSGPIESSTRKSGPDLLVVQHQHRRDRIEWFSAGRAHQRFLPPCLVTLQWRAYLYQPASTNPVFTNTVQCLSTGMWRPGHSKRWDVNLVPPSSSIVHFQLGMNFSAFPPCPLFFFSVEKGPPASATEQRGLP